MSLLLLTPQQVAVNPETLTPSGPHVRATDFGVRSRRDCKPATGWTQDEVGSQEHVARGASLCGQASLLEPSQRVGQVCIVGRV